MVQNRQRGFTLVELMIAVSLLSLVLVVGFNVFSFSQRSWLATSRESFAVQDADQLMARLGNEIRRASQPNSLTPSVRVVPGEGAFASGQRLDIYQFDDDSGSFSRIQYRLNPNDKTELQRGSTTSAEPDDTLNPTFGNISNWDTVFSGMPDRTDFAVFEDKTGDGSSQRRQIAVHLNRVLRDNDTFSLSSVFVSRTGRSGTTDAATAIPVNSITLNRTSLSLEVNNTFQLIHTLSPSEANDYNLIWSSSRPSVATVQNGLVQAQSSGNATITIRDEVTGRSASASVTVTNPPGGGGGGGICR